MGLPPKLLKRGITDMVRISDARMSGTAYGTVVLHVCPEAAVGGPLALVRDGDLIELDVEQRRLHLDVSEEEIGAAPGGLESWPPPMAGGYQRLYFDHVLQADTGADLDFLVGCRGNVVTSGNRIEAALPGPGSSFSRCCSSRWRSITWTAPTSPSPDRRWPKNWSYVLCQVLGGWLVDRIHPQKLYAVPIA